MRTSISGNIRTSIILAVGCIAMAAASPALCQTAGVLDSTFDGDGLLYIPFDVGPEMWDYGRDLVVQPDGKIIVVGTVQEADGSGAFGISRSSETGIPDGSFGTNGKTTVSFSATGYGYADASAVALQDDGKIVVVGTVGNTEGISEMAVCRLLSGGSLDASFGTGVIPGTTLVGFDYGGPNSVDARDVVIQPDGKIVILGTASRNDAGDYDFAVVRLTTGGLLDTTFGTSGKTAVWFDLGGTDHDGGWTMAIQDDGRLILAGTAEQDQGEDFAVARLLSNGALDSSFDGDGKQTVAFDVAGGSFSDWAEDVIVLRDGRITMVGNAVGPNDDSDFGIVQLLGNGALDPSFGVGGKIRMAFDVAPSYPQDVARGVAVQADGKLVIGGDIRVDTSDYDLAFVRLEANGDLDNTFGTAGITIVACNAGGDNEDSQSRIVLQPDHKILAVGSVERSSGGDIDFLVVRLTNDVTDAIFFSDFEDGTTSAWSSVVGE